MRSLPATTFALPARVVFPTPRPSPPRSTPGSLLAMPSGCIASDLRPAGFDPVRRMATYELLLANDTMSPVAAYAYVDGRPSGGMVSWNALTVAPFAAIAVTLDVPIAETAKERRRVVVEIHADLAQLTLDATPPFVPSTATVRKRVWAGAAAAAAVLVAATVGLARPRVVALAAPEHVAAGSRVDVAYATAGSGAWSYRLQTPDGMQVRAGTLDRRVGAFSFDLPRANATQSYDLVLTGAGRFGTTMQSTHVVAAVAAKPARDSARASIQALGLAREVVQSGAPIIATYRTNATSGRIELVDDGGNVRAAAPLSSHGASTLRAPTVTRDEEFAVVLHAARDNSDAQSSIGVVVRSNAPLYADLGVPQPPPASVAHAPSGDAPFALPAAPIHSGTPIDIAIVNPHDQMRITLASDSGAELSTANVDPSRPSVVLSAPQVSQDTKFLIEATYPSAIGEETVIRPIVVHPQSG